MKRRRSLVPTRTRSMFTRSQLKQFSKSRLITLVLKLQSMVIRRAVVSNVRSRRKKSKKYYFRPNTTHFVNIRGKRRKVRVLSNGRWKFLKSR